MYISPKASVFDRVEAAAGPGFHTDELSSAVEEIAGRLSGEAMASIVGVEEPETRDNPPDHDDDDEAVILVSDLFPISKLITGQWGPDVPSAFASVEVRPNPPDDARDYEPFFDRMRKCAAEVELLIGTANRRYDRNAERLAELARSARGKEAAELRRRSKHLMSGPRAWVDALLVFARGIEFVLRQERDPRRSILNGPVARGGRPLGDVRWSPLAAHGNSKLPFVAYSELPMATCPGAGTCRVPMDSATRDRMRSRGQAWCYSFKAFRYPRAWARMAFNTLCNYADREFAIMRGGGPSAPASGSRADLLAFHEERVKAAIRGRGGDGEQTQGRAWPQYVKAMIAAKTRRVRRGSAARGVEGKIAFVRLFVDGDINTEDCIVEWMEVCRQLGRGGRDVGQAERHVEVYGYTKCWGQFVNVDDYYARTGQAWPDNYTVNLSSGSLYAGGERDSKAGRVRARMESLPVSRGYFEAVPIDSFLEQLEAAASEAPGGKVRLPVVQETAFAVSPKRVGDFVRLNRVRTVEDLDSLFGGEWVGRFPALPPLRVRCRSDEELRRVSAAARSSRVPVEAVRGGDRSPPVERQVRRYAFTEYLSRLMRDDRAFGALVRGEIARDAGHKTERAYLKALRDRAERKGEEALSSGGAKERAFTEKALHDKALSLALHEVLWSHGLGGSCPLVCGNCSDRADPSDPDAVHRCASKTTYRGKTIHIGLH